MQRGIGRCSVQGATMPRASRLLSPCKGGGPQRLARREIALLSGAMCHRADAYKAGIYGPCWLSSYESIAFVGG